MKFSRADYNERIVDKEGRIPKDEPCFLLRGQDPHAPSTLRAYAQKIEDAGNKEMAEELRNHARQMLLWQKSVRVHEPDK